MILHFDITVTEGNLGINSSFIIMLLGYFQVRPFAEA